MKRQSCLSGELITVENDGPCGTKHITCLFKITIFEYPLSYGSWSDQVTINRSLTLTWFEINATLQYSI